MQHKAWNGMVLPADHEFWKTHYPPNGWGCGCRVVGASSADAARRLGGNPDYDTPPAGWDARDPKGRLPGIDKGWDYMPGQTVRDEVAQAVAAKTIAWPYELAKAYMAGVPAEMRDALAIAQRGQSETGEAVRRYAARALADGPQAVEPYRTMGLLTQAEAELIARLTGVEAVAQELYDWTVSQYSPIHIRNEHGDAAVEAARGQRVVEPKDYARLPQAILAPDRMWVEDRGKTLLLEKAFDNETIVAAFEPLKKRRMLRLKSMRVSVRNPRAQRP